ncbi:hypothetical protein [Arthrobacter caoxuetaonis]|uniref:Uncharacterized protein n=1 Tax=Arthrobacter caoxuetaonis TaxID=2886935 RepID=A0A9X1MGA0_9MICC|nr:hypothetical protein [Arthrobacter caoxuetaonis]MCC3299271.1 hypothetical protein [Arthrobacter caoxuetaonis]USQ59235.1 hypothetical protein NF551_16765 [Arthrobacter caoxuetaonis]
MKAYASTAAWLLAESGLTANQIGRCLDVPGRALHSWSHGTTPPPRCIERLEELKELILSLPADNPEDRRALLLDSAKGPSLFRRFMDTTPRSQRIQFTVPLIERLGA